MGMLGQVQSFLGNSDAHKTNHESQHLVIHRRPKSVEYVEDLEDDVEDIIGYYGKDFLIKPTKRTTPFLSYGDSFGVSRDSIQISYLIVKVILERETGFESSWMKKSLPTTTNIRPIILAT